MAADVYSFGEFTLEIGEQRLSRNGRSIPLAPKPLDVLMALVRSAGQLLTKRQLLDLVWPEAFVEEGILAVHISALRKALGESPNGRGFIETIPRTGYRFVAAVSQLHSNAVRDAEKRWTLAVLPGRPLTSEVLSGRDRATGLALADALIGRLGTVREIIVRPTRAVQAYINSTDDPAAIGRSLKADAVIDFQFLGVTDRIRISVRLIRCVDGATLWSGEFDESPAGVIAIVEPVAEAVKARLRSPSRRDDPKRGALRPAADPAVYELFGRGRFHLLSASIFELPKAVEAFRGAIQSDPNYAAAHAGLALAYCAQAAMRVVPPTAAYSEARAAALRALALDDLCADAQAALGAVMFFSEWNWTGAERSLQRALQLNPNHSEAYLLYGQLLDALGRLDEALEMKFRALERDPFSPLVHLQISMSYWHQRRYDDAIEWANKALEIDPKHPHAREHLAGAYLKKGDFESFFAENLKHAELHGAPPEQLNQLRRMCSAEGWAATIKLVLERAASNPQVFPSMQLAIFSGEAGDMDAAFRHLARAIESRDPCLVHLGVAPQWDSLRGDSRFDECLSQIGVAASRQS